VTSLFLLLALAAGLDHQDCLQHMEAHSPASDLAGEEHRAIIDENARLALWTRDSMPWGPSIPDSVFLRYVLPARVSQEPLVRWRPRFRDAVLPVVRGVETMEEAILLVSAWADSVIDYQPTQFRDQSPLVTWSSGIGRCEEMTVFFMDALRSVGIPCRQAYTPWWTTVDSNHAWPEVWTPGGWRYTDISAEQETLSSTWFTERARDVALVVAIAPDSVPGAMSLRGDVSVLNVTSSYAETGLLLCEEPPQEEVTVSVVNWGSYRPVTSLDSARTQVELGGGVYLLSWGWPVSSARVTVAAGDTTLFRPVPGVLPEHCLMNLEGGR